MTLQGRITADKLYYLVNMIYENSKKDAKSQLSYIQIAKECAVPRSLINDVRFLLKKRALLFEMGNKRGMTYHWNTDKAPANKLMCVSLLEDSVTVPKKEKKKQTESVSISLASVDDIELVTELRQRGYTVHCVKEL